MLSRLISKTPPNSPSTVKSNASRHSNSPNYSFSSNSSSSPEKTESFLMYRKSSERLMSADKPYDIKMYVKKTEIGWACIGKKHGENINVSNKYESHKSNEFPRDKWDSIKNSERPMNRYAIRHLKDSPTSSSSSLSLTSPKIYAITNNRSPNSNVNKVHSSPVYSPKKMVTETKAVFSPTVSSVRSPQIKQQIENKQNWSPTVSVTRLSAETIKRIESEHTRSATYPVAKPKIKPFNSEIKLHNTRSRTNKMPPINYRL